MNKPFEPAVVNLRAVPRHVAIIMDGNGRWADQRGLPTPAGHRAGVEAVRSTLEACQQQGIEVLTLFAFSSENWGRPEGEVRALMALLCNYLRREVQKLNKDDIRLRFIGRRNRLSPHLQRLMERSEKATADNRGATLVLAVDYGGRWDLTHAVRRIASEVAAGNLRPDEIGEAYVGGMLSLGDLPPPDLCIRTGGDKRISNFLLWQFAYTELYFSNLLWPDFDGHALTDAIRDFRVRERRFGIRNVTGVLQQSMDKPRSL